MKSTLAKRLQFGLWTATAAASLLAGPLVERAEAIIPVCFQNLKCTNQGHDGMCSYNSAAVQCYCWTNSGGGGQDDKCTL